MLPCTTPTLVTSLAKSSFSWSGSSNGGFGDPGGDFGGVGMDNAFQVLLAQPSRASSAGTALGLGDLLAPQVSDETDELPKKRMTQLAGRPDLAGLRYGSSVVGGPVSLAFSGGLRLTR
jgi:hypothetical protein